MRHDRSSSIAFLLSVGAIPLGCPAGEEGGSGQTSFATSVGNGASTNPSSGSGDSEGTGTDGSMSTTEATDASESMSSTMTASTTAMTTTTTMSTTEPATDPSLTDPSGVDPDTGYGTYGSGGQFMCTGAVQSQACGAYGAKVIECYPKYAGMEAEIAYNCNCSIEYYNTYYGPACGGAIEDFYACLASTSCQELAGGAACAQADMNVIATCGFGG